MSSNHDAVMKAAKEHIEKIKGMRISKNPTDRKKEVRCGMCYRKMTVRGFEHAPYYCYKCDDELEGVLQ